MRLNKSAVLLLVLLLLALVHRAQSFAASRVVRPARLGSALRASRVGDSSPQQPPTASPASSAAATAAATAAAAEIKTKMVSVNVLHMPRIFELTMDEFKPTCRSASDVDDLAVRVLWLFLPKLLLPWLMGNQLIGIECDGVLVGFVDVSLQPQTLAALDIVPLFLRRLRHRGVTESATTATAATTAATTPTTAAAAATGLRPYLCNLFVAPTHRRRGVGKQLVAACLDLSRSWGFSELFLHVEESERAAWGLYSEMGFAKVAVQGYATLMVGKTC